MDRPAFILTVIFLIKLLQQAIPAVRKTSTWTHGATCVWHLCWALIKLQSRPAYLCSSCTSIHSSCSSIVKHSCPTILTMPITGGIGHSPSCMPYVPLAQCTPKKQVSGRKVLCSHIAPGRSSFLASWQDHPFQRCRLCYVSHFMNWAKAVLRRAGYSPVGPFLVPQSQCSLQGAVVLFLTLPLVGMAFRMGQDLGFQQDPLRWVLQDQNLATPADIEIRRRIYWGCYLADKYACMPFWTRFATSDMSVGL